MTDTRRKIFNNFIKELSDFYGKNPYGHGFALRLVAEFGTLSEDQLNLAAKSLIERSKKTFPSMDECQLALRKFSSKKPGNSKSITANNYEQEANNFARGNFVFLTADDKIELSAWETYFKHIEKKYYVYHISQVRIRNFKALAVPARFPKEFDVNAPALAFSVIESEGVTA